MTRTTGNRWFWRKLRPEWRWWFGLLLAMCVWSVWQGDLVAATVVMDEPPSSVDSEQVLLSGTLLQSRAEEEALLSLRNAGISDSSFEILQQVFGRTADGFLWDPVEQRWRSLRGFALELLKRSPVEVQRAWDRTIFVSSAERLRQVLATGDGRALELLAESCPLSVIGLRAQGLMLTSLWLRGDVAGFESHWKRLAAEYSGSPLESQFHDAVAPVERLWQRRVSAAGPRSASAVSSGLSREARVLPSVAPAWPEATWSWHETVWIPGGATQLEASRLLMSYHPEDAGKPGSFQNWPPVPWGPWLVCRTPFRLVALDPATGRECWSLLTTGSATEASADSTDDTERTGSTTAQIWETEPERIARWGLLSADAEYLWLVDQFDAYMVEEQVSRVEFRRGRFPWEQQKTALAGGRLIALKRAPGEALPELAWIAGMGSFADYQIVPRVTSLRDGLAPAADVVDAAGMEKAAAAVADADFPTLAERGSETPRDDSERPQTLEVTGHHFCGPPLVHGERLYVLSESADFVMVSGLQRTTGRVLWQQPLAWRGVDSPGAGPHGFDSCVLCGETLICSLQQGAMLGLSAANGQFRWALSGQTEAVSPESAEVFLRHMDIWRETPSRPIFLPVVDQSRVICSTGDGSRIRCVDGATGRVQWDVSAAAILAETTRGSLDQYVAGVVQGAVILIGEQHCRSLDLQDGRQRWLVEIDPASGPAVCSADRCLIPRHGGLPMCIQLSDGTRIPETQHLWKKTGRAPAGTIVGDAERIFVANPGMVTAYPRVDRLPEQTISPEETPLLRAVQRRARALLLDGQRQAAITLLQEHLQPAREGVGKKDSQLLAADLAELLLDEWRQSWLTQPTAAADGSLPGPLPELAKLDLTPDQEYRAALLALLTGTSAEKLPDDWRAALQKPRRRTLLPLSETWSVLPELILPDASPLTTLSPGLPSDGRSLLERAEAAILFPERQPSAEGILQLADQLVDNGHAAAAELLLLAWWEQIGEGHAEERQRVETLLQQVRLEQPPGDTWRLSETGGGTEGTTASRVVSTDFGKAPVLIPELRFASVVSEMRNAVNVLPTSSVPWWLQHELVVSRQRGESPKPLLEIVARDGTGVLSQLPETEYDDGLSVPFLQTNYGVSAPGLIPMQDRNRLMMLAVNNTGQSRILWSRKLAVEPDSFLPGTMMVSLGARYFVWHLDGVLHCTHPLTGIDLWTRRQNIRSSALPQSELEERPIFGDERVTAVYDSEQGLLQTYSTRTGKPGQRYGVRPGLGTRCGTVGRFLIYTDLNYHLRILDTATCTLVPGDGKDIVIGPQHLEQLYAVLPGNVLVTITSERELVLIDLSAGQVQSRVPLPEGTVISTLAVKAFEHGEQVYVVVEDQALAGGVRAMSTSASQLSERSINDGLLVCLPREKDRVLWARRLEKCLFPVIAGAPTDLLVACTAGFGRDRMEDGGLTDLLQVQVLDGATGTTAAEASGLPLSMPAWVYHDPLRAEIRLQCTNGQVLIRPDVRK